MKSIREELGLFILNKTYMGVGSIYTPLIAKAAKGIRERELASMKMAFFFLLFFGQ